MYHEEWDKNALCAAFIEDNPDVVKEIRAEGVADAKREMAKAMLVKGFPLGTIAEVSNLSEDEIRAL